MDQQPSDPAAAVGVGMDRLELSMSYGGVHHTMDVAALHEAHQVVHQRRNPPVGWSLEICGLTGGADPHRAISPRTEVASQQFGV